jgi:prepilin-type N-terminal cleavage/methylation domain-containing protein
MSRRPGFTLIELLIVFAVVAILVAAMIPDMRGGAYDQLESAARVVAADMAYARSLAVTYNSTYRVTFDLSNQRYILEHSGTNIALNTLPNTAFRNTSDPSNQHIVRLADLPGLGAPTALTRAVRVGSSVQSATNVEFGSLGGTTQSEYTVILLTAGNGADRRRIYLAINPITGLTTIAHNAAEMPSEVADKTASITE